VSVAELKQHEKVRTWFAGAHHDQLPEADQQHYLEVLAAFLAGVGKDPDSIVAFCYLRKRATGERFLSQQRRAEVNEMIEAWVQGNGWTGKTAVRMANVVRGYLIHNGVLIQGPVWTKG
jgi:hypothetical protein